MKLFDKASGAPIGEISAEQFKILQDVLEEESRSDSDYYINRATLDILRDAGADAGLLTVLNAALGDREDMDIAW